MYVQITKWKTKRPSLYQLSVWCDHYTVACQRDILPVLSPVVYTGLHCVAWYTRYSIVKSEQYTVQCIVYSIYAIVNCEQSILQTIVQTIHCIVWYTSIVPLSRGHHTYCLDQDWPHQDLLQKGGKNHEQYVAEMTLYYLIRLIFSFLLQVEI